MDKNKILVLGNGFLGKAYAADGYTVWGRDKFEVKSEYIAHVFDEVRSKLKNTIRKYDAVINCIGCADTRSCEDPSNWESTFIINSELPKALSEVCYEVGTKFVHISSGCVYDQNNTPQKEDAHLSSHCKYVVSKLVGEFGCCSKDLILRPRLYFGQQPDKNNLLCKLPKFNKFLTEMNSFTSVETIVGASYALLKNKCSGVFNVANKGFTNMETVAKLVGVRNPEVMTASQLIEQEGLYLVNNIMDTSKLEQYYEPENVLTEIQKCNTHTLISSLVTN